MRELNPWVFLFWAMNFPPCPIIKSLMGRKGQSMEREAPSPKERGPKGHLFGAGTNGKLPKKLMIFIGPGLRGRVEALIGLSFKRVVCFGAV